MKFFILSAIASLIIVKSNESNSVQCGEGKVTMAGKGICIQPEYIEGCQSYLSQNQCASCNPSYMLSNKRCNYIGSVTNYQPIPGCLTFDSASQRCTNCANGFVKTGSGCKKGHRNCNAYDEAGRCTDCKNDHSLVLGHCRHNLLLGCRSQQLDHTCTDCFAPFKKNGNHCDIAHCKSYNDFGCVGCQCGYFLTPDRSCKQVTSGCIRYQRGVCTNCLPHYKLKGGSCEIDGCSQYDANRCTKCQQRYTLTSDGGCSFNNCYDWLNGKCLVCNSGYRVQNDECVKLTEQELKCM